MTNESIVDNSKFTEYLDQTKGFLGPLGDKVSDIFGKIFSWVSSLGLSMTILQIKIVSLIVLCVLFYLILKFMSFGKKIVKIIIEVLILFFIIAIIFSF